MFIVYKLLCKFYVCVLFQKSVSFFLMGLGKVLTPMAKFRHFSSLIFKNIQDVMLKLSTLVNLYIKFHNDATNIF